MGILGTIMERRGTQGAGSHPSSPMSWWSSLFGGGTTKAGVEMNEWAALNLSTVWACVSAISADVAKLPFHVYKRLPDGGKDKAVDHPAWWLLNSEPNPEMSAFTFRETLGWWVLNWGNGLAEIERRGNGKPLYLWPMEPWRTNVRRLNDGTIVYDYTPQSGRTRTLPAEDVFHIRGMGDGVVGLNVIRFARESMGAARAADIYASTFFGNGAQAGGILKHPGKLGTKAQKNITDSWNAQHQGADKAHGISVLEEGMEYLKTTIPPEEAQFLQTRQFSVPEICRWYRFPPHKAQDLSRATFSNIEQQDLQYVGDTTYPWMRRWEQEANRKLLQPSERRTYFLEHLVDALLRTDIKSRYEAYAIAKQNGWTNGDEIREKENQNPMPDGQGKIFTVQVNMTTPTKLAEDPPAAKDPNTPTDPNADPAADPALNPAGDPAPQDPPPTKSKRRTARAIVAAARPVLVDAYARMLRVESDKVRRAAKSAGFPAWVDEFYGQHAEVVRAPLFPIVEAIADSVRAAVGDEIPARPDGQVRACVDALVSSHIARSLADAKGPAGSLEQRLAAWDTDRPEAQAVQDLEVLAARLIATWVKE